MLSPKALGVELDLQDKGLGVRSRRYAMLLEDGVVSLPTLNPPRAPTQTRVREMEMERER